ncbi:hypothetical protein [Streptomyces sp. CC210A]|uniref:hypothetical protein n=1 Tax=Streptomyces sp. CC210A TaxID=2898184 RepID=UPI001F16514E|nr:hypothetical protein [Streptomyces sp. CC210A]
MGLSIYPAPEDAGVVGPTGATGPQGPKGDTGSKGAAGPAGATGPRGAPGSQLLTGTAAPTPSDGTDGDLFVQDDTRTYLGVTSTTLTFWKKTLGAWAKVGDTVGGSKWYMNTSSTSSADTKPGDMLLRTDTGDIWQRSASGWGSSIGNLKGPRGETGPQGPKGDPGNGSVNTVNGKPGPDPVLTASDVKAVANSGGYSRMDGMLHVVYAGTSADAFKASNAAQTDYTAINKDAQLVTNTTATLADLRVGQGGATFGGGSGGVIAFANAASPPTANPSGAVLWAEGGALKVRQSNGSTFALGSATPLGGFAPEDLGLKAWAFDPALTQSTPSFCGTTPRLAAVKLASTQTVSKIVWHFGGYAGGLISGSWAAIYNTSLARVGVASSIESGNEPGEQHGPGGNASATALDSSVTLAPGVYYVVWRFNYNTSTGDGPMILGAENGFGAPSNTFGLNKLWRFGRLSSSPTSAPTTLSGIANESNRFWVALA